ncbi:lipid IV(A) 3-deoxy-D-manno-octulosonic acid transferase [soil metagenome]
MPTALDILYAVAVGALAPFWARKRRAAWGERFGRVPREVAARLRQRGRPRLLIHAVSVGEVSALRTLVPRLTGEVEVVIATTTDTGFARATALFGAACVVVRYPLDFSGAVRRFLEDVKPDAVALVELEVWPQFIRACAARGVPVAVINGRLSAKSLRGYRRIRWIIKGAFGALAQAAVQDEDYRARFVAMGTPAERVTVTGNMKWDSALEQLDARGEGIMPGAEALGAALGIERTRPLIVAGSTAEGEEALLHGACPPGVQLLCAPRKPERFAEAARALPGCVRRSEISGGTESARTGATGADRFLLDTLGELRAAYALADVVVIGRTFFSLGGSDPLEAIGVGKAVVSGPSFANFGTITAALEEAGAIEIVAAEGLGAKLAELLNDPQRRGAMSAAGAACIRGHAGATERHAILLRRLATEACAARRQG